MYISYNHTYIYIIPSSRHHYPFISLSDSLSLSASFCSADRKSFWWKSSMASMGGKRGNPKMTPFTKTKKWTMTSSSWWLNHPFETYARQIGSFLQVAVKIKKMWNHQPVFIGFYTTLSMTKNLPQHFAPRFLGTLKIAASWSPFLRFLGSRDTFFLWGRGFNHPSTKMGLNTTANAFVVNFQCWASWIYFAMPFCWLQTICWTRFFNTQVLNIE